jgi:hypothetical protein
MESLWGGEFGRTTREAPDLALFLPRRDFGLPPMPRNSGANRANPSPSLRPLDRLLGTWRIRGRTPDSPSDNIRGIVRYAWSDDRTFLESRGSIKVGTFEVRALEVLTYAGKPGNFVGWVFSGGQTKPLRYRWVFRGNRVLHAGLGATFRGSFSRDGRKLSGGWFPDPGRRRLPGSRYDSVMTRIDSHERS